MSEVETDLPVRRSLSRGGLVLAPAVGLANGIQYGYNVLMAALLGPSAFGALGALLALVLIGSVPGLALQTVVARHAALLRADGDPGALWRATLRLSARWSAVLVAATALASPALRGYLHLGSVVPALMLALVVAPTPFGFAAQGALLGREAFARLGAVNVAGAVCKLAGGLALVAAGLGLTGALAGAAAGSVVGALAGLALARGATRREPAAAAPGPGTPPLDREALVALLGLVGLYLLTNLDVPLARHYLPPAASGLYALGGLVAKIAFWGPQFAIFLVFARLVTSGDRRRLLAGSAATIVVSGVLLAAGLAVLARLDVALPLLGRDYARITPLLPLFAMLGSSLAVVELLLFEQIAVGARRMGRLLVAAAAVEVALVAAWLHHSIGQIVGTGLAVALTLVAVGAWRAVRQPNDGRRGSGA
jgi:O-antigen/teichoic acid export membrane protein